MSNLEVLGRQNMLLCQLLCLWSYHTEVCLASDGKKKMVPSAWHIPDLLSWELSFTAWRKEGQEEAHSLKTLLKSGGLLTNPKLVTVLNWMGVLRISAKWAVCPQQHTAPWRNLQSPEAAAKLMLAITALNVLGTDFLLCHA